MEFGKRITSAGLRIGLAAVFLAVFAGVMIWIIRSGKNTANSWT